MRRVVPFLGFLVTASSLAYAQSAPKNMLPSDAPAASSNLPALPPGRSTVMGGEVARVDAVQDQLLLKVAGGHTVKILFDERTQVYQDGKKISVMDLRPEDHASIETTLDGTSIFAVRIHLLSKLPDGEVHGKVEAFNRATGELKLQIAASSKPVTLAVPSGTPVARIGQPEFVSHGGGTADLIPGSVIDVSFQAGKSGAGAATRINVRAVPGSEFVIRGSLASLDLRAGRMSINTEDSDRPMDISFEPAKFDVSRELKQGGMVKVTARFDGSRYTASSIAVE